MSEEQWQAIEHRDVAYDGLFFYALKSTKIVCRPSCPSRQPKPKNVEIFYSLEEAVRCGCRPCQRCRPEQPSWQGPKNELGRVVRDYVDEHYQEKISASILGQVFYTNPFYLYRVFREENSTTPLNYQHEVRISRAKELLISTNETISDIGFDVGYNTLSHFSRVFKKITGLSPSKFRLRQKAARNLEP